MTAHHWRLERHERFVEKGTCACGAVRFFANDFCKEAIETADDYNKKHSKTGDPEYHNVIKKEEIKTVKQTLPPIPPRTEIKGDNKIALHKYYMDNKVAIITDFNALGEKDTRERWGITESGWRTLRAHLMPDKFQLPDWAKPKPAGKIKRECHKKEKAVKETVPATEATAPATEPHPLIEEDELCKQAQLYKSEDRGWYKTANLADKTPEQQENRYQRSLPAFPAFNDNWPEKVQSTWLVVYQELAGCAASV